MSRKIEQRGVTHGGILCRSQGNQLRHHYGDANSPQEKEETSYTMGNTVWSSGEYEFSEPKRVLVRSRDDR
jgi:hypothetical protein